MQVVNRLVTNVPDTLCIAPLSICPEPLNACANQLNNLMIVNNLAVPLLGRNDKRVTRWRVGECACLVVEISNRLEVGRGKVDSYCKVQARLGGWMDGWMDDDDDDDDEMI